jgi:adenylate cyclase
MPQVFVSYARSTEAQAQQVAEALRTLGHEVWRDDELPAHRTYSEVIEERLQAAGAVVVIWSAEALKSQWVRAEADAAREKGTLIQVSVDGTVPPMPFNQIQCADLKGWDGDVSAAGWRKVEGSVAALIGESSAGPSERGAQRLREHSICVLPFANMSGDSEQEYFSDGISEDITTDLSKVSALAVTARNTAFTFKGRTVKVCDIAEELGVSHVLEGSVRKAGGRVRITAQLIDGTTGDHVWAERYDRELTDIFAIQDEISKAIVAALKLKLLPAEKKAIEQRGTTSAEAYNLYLMARQYWITGNHGDRSREKRVVRICRRALEIDPEYARAWALMAIAQSNLRYGFSIGEDREENGLVAANRALALDPTIAEAHCPIARQLAEEHRFEEADAEIALALSIDPNSWEVNKEAARIYLRQRRMADAARYFERATEIMETDFHAWGILGSCYHALGNSEGVVRAAQMGLKQVERVLAEDPNNGAAYSFGVGDLATLGRVEQAREWMERGLLVDPDNLNMRHNFACALAAYLHDKQGALDMLESVLAVGSQRIVDLTESDPDFDSVRDDPRFNAMIARTKARLASEQGQPAH